MIPGPLDFDELLNRARNVHRADMALAEAEYRERVRLLQIVVALSPFTGATSAPPGHRGRPIEPVPPHLQRSVPRQRSEPPRGLCAPFHHRRADR